MFSPRDQVIVEFSHINQGDTLSGQMCPKCNGGGDREHSMSVGRSEGGWLWWRCHRASCNFRGGERSDGPKPRGPAAKKEVGKLTYRSVTLIGNKLWNELRERFGLTDNLMANAKWRWTPDYGGRVIMPIIGPDGQTRGENLRSYDPNALKKAMIQRLADGELICWYKFQKYPQVLVVVEDQPSALRVAGVRGFASLALLGTNLSYERAQEIKASGIKKIVLCLDNDATAEAIRQVVEYRRLLPTIKLVALRKDVKNMTAQELEAFVDEVKEVTQGV